MLNVDLSRAARSYTERLAIVQAVASAPRSEPETDWIEWKSSLDLTTREGAFKLARTVLGFGNRDPDYAARFARGCAYFIVGLEPGTVTGTTAHDPANVEQWVRRYVAHGEPQWSVDYVSFGNSSVMFVTVEAPRWGDDIFTLQATYEKAGAGTVFVRSNGKTDYATPQAMRQLTARARRADVRVSVDVQWRDERQLHALALAPEQTASFAAQELARLAPDAAERDGTMRGSFMSGDRRSPTSYRAEVADYLPRAPRRFELLACKRAIDRAIAKVSLVVDNQTDVNYPDTQVVLRLPADIDAHFDSATFREELDELEVPREWGSVTMLGGLGVVPLLTPYNLIERIRPDGRKVERTSAHVSVTLPSVDVRPHTKHELTPVHLIVPSTYVGENIEVVWRATSTGAAGEISGVIVADVVGAVNADELVAAEIQPDWGE